MRTLRSFRFWLGIAVSLVSLWLLVKGVPFDNLGHILADGDYTWLIPAIAMQLAGVVTRAQRWVVLLGKEGTLGDAFWAEGVGYLFTNLLPLRMGEPARIAALSGKCRLPVVQVTISAVLERLLDLTAMVVVLALVIPWMQVPEMVSRVGLSLAALVLVALTALLLAGHFQEHGERIVLLVCQRVPALSAESIISRWSEMVAGISSLTHRGTASRAVGWSAITWALSIGFYWCVMHAFQPRSDLLEASFMVAALSMAVTVPSSPGFIGVFQLVGQQALVLPFAAKYDSGTALAITFTIYLAYYLTTTLLGVGGLWYFGESFIGLATRSSSRQPVPGPRAMN